ncbi:unnamed protein product [Ixodes pacificus]
MGSPAEPRYGSMKGKMYGDRTRHGNEEKGYTRDRPVKTVRVFGPGKVAPQKEYKCWETLERNTNRHITKCTAKKVYAVHTTNNAFRVSTCTRHVARKECNTNGRVLTTSQQTRQRPEEDVWPRRMLKHDYEKRAAHTQARKRPSLTGS